MSVWLVFILFLEKTVWLVLFLFLFLFIGVSSYQKKLEIYWEADPKWRQTIEREIVKEAKKWVGTCEKDLLGLITWYGFSVILLAEWERKKWKKIYKF